jgi:transforming growth factor-beta-induced protein
VTEHKNNSMNQGFLVKGWLLLSVALAAREALYTRRSLSQRIAKVLRRPTGQPSFQRQTTYTQPSTDEPTVLGWKKTIGQYRTLKGHSPHSYGQYFAETDYSGKGLSGKGSSGKGSSGKGSKKSNGKGKGSSKSEKSKKKEKKDKKEKKHMHDLPSVCEKLDFRSYYPDSSSSGYPGKDSFSDDDDYAGKGKGSRRLQFQGPGCDMNVFEVAREIPSLSTFVSLVEAAHLEDLFMCAGPFSVLAPTNQAFDANPSLTESLFKITTIEELREVLLYHILPGLFLQEDFDDGEITTLQGESVEISVSPLSIDGSSVEEADVLGCNGALQAIDKVLVPRSKQRSPDVFYSHSLAAAKPVVDEPEICSNLDFSNDKRLVNSAPGSCDSNLFDVASQESELSTFVSLIKAADLSDVFYCVGPLTVLAPNNAAFAGIEVDTMNQLMLPANKEKLQNILLYHVIPGLKLSAALTEGPLNTLLKGQDVDVTLSPITFNLRSEVVEVDIVACNGNLIIVDEVLVPGMSFHA